MTIDHLSIVWTGEIYNYEFVPDGEGQEGPRFVLEKPLTNWVAIYMLFGISIGTALGTSFLNQFQFEVIIQIFGERIWKRKIGQGLKRQWR